MNLVSYCPLSRDAANYFFFAAAFFLAGAFFFAAAFFLVAFFIE